MKKYKIGICGHFGGDKEFLDGQTIKTKAWKNALEEVTATEVKCVDTYNWRAKKLNLFKECINLSKDCEHVIIMPARPGIKVILPIFIFGKAIFRCKVHYIVIGGWIAEYLQENKWLWKLSKMLDGIYTEGKIVLKKLELLDIKRVNYLPNFKNIKPLDMKEIDFDIKSPYKVCTLSRVIKEKGIKDAIDVIKKINTESNEIIYTLDIYGPIDKNYEEEFETIKETLPDYIKYKGAVPSNKTVDILKDYFMLLFPTRYPGEGLPGTILDAYAAGLPVVASKWDSYSDIIDENETGIVYKLYDIKDFKNKMENISREPMKIIMMKKNCIQRANDYLPSCIVGKFMTMIER